MRTQMLAAVVGMMALPFTAAAAETWQDVSVVDTLCLARVKGEPDKHTTQCALQCVKGGYGLITPDGAYLTFDAAGNEKTVAALKATKRLDHVRATVVGERTGDAIKVASVIIE
jgi:hypothetical protein